MCETLNKRNPRARTLARSDTLGGVQNNTKRRGILYREQTNIRFSEETTKENVYGGRGKVITV